MVRLTLVRHGPPVVDPSVSAAEWVLDPARRSQVVAIRPALPARAVWFSSPEPKATATAAGLTDGPVTVVDGLREAERPATWFDDPADFVVAVRRSFEVPDEPAVPGWEPAAATRSRVVGVVRELLTDEQRPAELVLVGHGTAWTLLVAELTGRAPDLAAWERMAMPDLAIVDVPTDGGPASLLRAWGTEVS